MLDLRIVWYWKIKDPGHDSELQAVSEMASNVCFLLDRRKCLSLFSSAHGAPLGARFFPRRES